MDRFIKNVNKLPKFIKNRLVFENDEKCYDAEDVLKICKQVNRPMVFDYHHYQCFPHYNKNIIRKSINKLLPHILKTWSKHGIRPKLHLSEQMPNKQIGSHSLFIEKIPKELLEIPKKYRTEIDIMIEAKGKEIAISKLYKKYPSLRPKNSMELPNKIPKEAINNLKMPEEIKEIASCDCDEVSGGYDLYFNYIKYRNKYKKLKN